MTTKMTSEAEVAERSLQRRPQPSPPPAGGAVYGLGLIGALVWFWRRSDGVGGHALAVGKAIVWPAILVHDAFKALNR